MCNSGPGLQLPLIFLLGDSTDGTPWKIHINPQKHDVKCPIIQVEPTTGPLVQMIFLFDLLGEPTFMTFR